jgi:glycosyltransferase involved in cell wall biosynthesis
MMRVALLAPASVIHTQRWVNGLTARGIDVLLLTQHPAIDWQVPVRASLRVLPFRGEKGYFFNLLAARRALSEFSPDLVNSHYASGYGTLATLVARKPHLMSVWGSDVYDFPYQSALAGWLIRFNLRRADCIASTSHVMSAQVGRLVRRPGKINITPFGVDSGRFLPRDTKTTENWVTVGTVKTLADKYGIDLLIDAFARLVRDADVALDGVRERLRLLLIGDGPQRATLEAQVEALGMRSRVTFAGQVTHSEVPGWLNRLDIYVAASRLDSESFGVAVIEASSCGLPVVVSDVGGLPEVVQQGVTGLIVPRNDSAALCAALKQLVLDDGLRAAMGRAGRALVQREYEWERCVDKMVDCYARVVHRHGAPAAARPQDEPA